MKQLVLHLRNGQIDLVDTPTPQQPQNAVLIKTSCTLVSSGTEKMLIEFGKAGWFEKARQQPERVKQVINKIKTDGLKPTIESVFNKLDTPIPLGYCNVGIIESVNIPNSNLKKGDRVVSNGSHADFVIVPQALIAKIPNNVTDEEASFTVVGAIALQAIRLIQPTFGEKVVVVGLGLIGQLALQLLRANGCQVIGIDTDLKKIALAQSLGFDAFLAGVEIDNVDAVIIAASAKEDNIISQAAQMCRKRGRIVLIGVIDLNLNRADFYEKEINFQVSCSYGPGRYDYGYEHQNIDYPMAYVRWTEQRNFEAFLSAIASKQLNLLPLISLKSPIDNYIDTYHHLENESGIAAIFQFNIADNQLNNTQNYFTPTTEHKGNIGIIGAGNFTSNILLPNLKKAKANLIAINSENGLNAGLLAKKWNIAQACTDYFTILNDKKIDTLFITTPHYLHSKIASEGLLNKKNLFIEKPLALNDIELNEFILAYQQNPTFVHVGFNRRFSAFAVKMKSLISNPEKMHLIYTINAGKLLAKNWLSDVKLSGGRIIGEVCHFIDTIAYLTESPVAEIIAQSVDQDQESISVLLKMNNGAQAAIHFFTNGNSAFDKEKIELFESGKILVLENWKKLTGYGYNGFSSINKTQDKGHFNQIEQFLNHIKNGLNPLITFESLINTTRASFAIEKSIQTQSWIKIPQ